MKDLHAAVKEFPLLRVQNTIVTNENEEAFLEEIMKFLQFQVIARKDRNFAPELMSGGVKYLVVDAGTFKIRKTSDAYETATRIYEELSGRRQKPLAHFWKDK